MPKIEDAKLVKGLVPGTKTDTLVVGKLTEARKIAKHSLDVVQRFSEAVISQDIETAYGLCANELRCWMSVQRFLYGAWQSRRAVWRQAHTLLSGAHHVDLRRRSLTQRK